MSQCEHEFALDKATKEVRCVRCGDLDDEMLLPSHELEEKEATEELFKSQMDFE
jgi:hypothetical protein